MATPQEISKSLEKKLLKPSSDAGTAILSGVFLAIYILLALNVTGALAIAGWAVVVFQLLAMFVRMIGWKIITLTNEEQDYLKKYLTVKRVEKVTL